MNSIADIRCCRVWELARGALEKSFNEDLTKIEGLTVGRPCERDSRSSGSAGVQYRRTQRLFSPGSGLALQLERSQSTPTRLRECPILHPSPGGSETSRLASAAKGLRRRDHRSGRAKGRRPARFAGLYFKPERAQFSRGAGRWCRRRASRPNTNASSGTSSPMLHNLLSNA
jgi:hypothetical protein